MGPMILPGNIIGMHWFVRIILIIQKELMQIFRFWRDFIGICCLKENMNCVMRI